MTIVNLMIVLVISIVAYVIFDSIYAILAVVVFGILKIMDTPCEDSDYFEN